MKKYNLVAIILQIVCGLACIGFGIYFCVKGDVSQILIFFIVGVVCFVNAVRLYLNGKKGGKDE